MMLRKMWPTKDGQSSSFQCKRNNTPGSYNMLRKCPREGGWEIWAAKQANKFLVQPMVSCFKLWEEQHNLYEFGFYFLKMSGYLIFKCHKIQEDVTYRKMFQCANVLAMLFQRSNTVTAPTSVQFGTYVINKPF